MILFADWTSAALTLHRLDADGRILGTRSARIGAIGHESARYRTELAGCAGDWLGAAEAIYVAGMATGRGGWVETDYAATPAQLGDLAGLVRQDRLDYGTPVRLLPGLAVAQPLPDVMRGEELKIFGLGEGFGGVVILPGRHAKWARVAAGRVTGFATFLSGEIAALLLSDSIVSRLVPQGAVVTEAGLRRGLAHRGGPLRSLFSARSLVLSQALAPADIPGYVTGLLLGAEVREALEEFPVAQGNVTLIGSAQSALPYRAALAATVPEERFSVVDPAALAALSIARLHRLTLTGTIFQNMEHPGRHGGAA
ncbi:MAG: 2-dehydro-3-deoxygalactonokinase [Devosia sp.]